MGRTEGREAVKSRSGGNSLGYFNLVSDQIPSENTQKMREFQAKRAKNHIDY